MKLPPRLASLLLAAPFGAATADPYLVSRYDSLHDTPAPRRFRALAPMPAGVVCIQQPGEGEREMRAHFRQMRELGFNAPKQIMPLPDWTVERIQLERALGGQGGRGVQPAGSQRGGDGPGRAHRGEPRAVQGQHPL